MSDNYTVDPSVSPDEHRYVFLPLKYRNINGNLNKDMAKVGELLVDEETGEIWYKKDNDTLVSPTATMREAMDKLLRSDLLYQTAYNINNASIYNVYYTSEGACRLDDAIRLSRNVRYYSIRKSVDPETNNGKSNIYITGIVGDNNSVVNALVDVLPFTSDANIEYNGIAQIGNLYNVASLEGTEGAIFYIDFYDNSRNVITTVPCQMIKTESMNFALTSEINIDHLTIESSQPDTDPNTNEPMVYLYAGQDPKTVNLYVYAVYSDGTRRLLNSDLASGKLLLTYGDLETMSEEDYLREITTVGNEFTVEAKYFVAYISGSNDTTYNVANYESISATIKFKVVQDVYKAIRYLVPIPFITKTIDGQNNYNTACQFKTFAIYEDYTDGDLSGNSNLSIDFGGNDWPTGSDAVNYNGTASIPMGHGSIRKETNFVVNTSASDPGSKFSLSIESLNAYYSNYEGSFPKYKVIFNSIDYPGQLALSIVKMDANNEWVPINSNVLKQDGTVKYGTSGSNVQKVPTHFRVRSLLDTNHIYTAGTVPIASMSKKVDPSDGQNEYTFFYGKDSIEDIKKLSKYNIYNQELPYPVLLELFWYNEDIRKYELLSIIPAETEEDKIVEGTEGLSLAKSSGYTGVLKTYNVKYTIESGIFDNQAHNSGEYPYPNSYGVITLPEFTSIFDDSTRYTRDGVEFDHWVDSDDVNETPLHSGEQYQLYKTTEATTFIAKFDQVVYVDVSDGYTGNNPIVYPVHIDNHTGQAIINMPSQIYTRPGWAFQGWRFGTDATTRSAGDGTPEVIENAVAGTRYTLTAIWDKIVQVRFFGKAGTPFAEYINRVEEPIILTTDPTTGVTASSSVTITGDKPYNYYDYVSDERQSDYNDDVRILSYNTVKVAVKKYNLGVNSETVEAVPLTFVEDAQNPGDNIITYAIDKNCDKIDFYIEGDQHRTVTVRYVLPGTMESTYGANDGVEPIVSPVDINGNNGVFTVNENGSITIDAIDIPMDVIDAAVLTGYDYTSVAALAGDGISGGVTFNKWYRFNNENGYYLNSNLYGNINAEENEPEDLPVEISSGSNITIANAYQNDNIYLVALPNIENGAAEWISNINIEEPEEPEEP